MNERGTLEVHPSVVRKVAARAAGRGAVVKVTGEGNDVDVAVRLPLPYAVPVRAAASEVRRTVTEEVQRITGYRVRGVDVTVSALVSEPRPRVE
ncbi:Asp23/Gls24 family envelope stress response protein [Saccharothrix variisporea]|uniref:Putative alkaline shock family protein YloU n=1 Tax=Saccharothrix variisporea TaxID=543527 RepID=A0A495X6S2_9PSEU|nr:Asp23/Gls24 family envelope stress response protein [Saccharothrix variisporea]RKT69597.1 putative alkaline shock family protein YloU [Saccharothrix variisporea]